MCLCLEMTSQVEDSAMNALRFGKLNSSNYRTWSFNMKLYLESQDLFEHVDGTAEEPDGDDIAREARIFRQRAKKAWTYICLAVEPEQQIHVRDTTTAAEAWNALKNQFARESIVQKVRLRQQYYSCRFENGGNMLTHINHLRSLHDQLKEMGASIDDKELAMTLLSSLPDEFKPLITALDAVGEDNLSFEKVKGMLLNDYERSNDSIAVQTKKSEDALAARRGRWNKNSRGKQEPRGNNSKYEKPFKGLCHSCKERGHFARDCPKKNSGDRGNSSAHCVQGGEEQIFNEEEALVTSDRYVKFDWIIDSGATQHMSFDLDSLEEYVEFQKPCSVNLGDNRVIFAYGRGTYRVTSDVHGSTECIALKDVLYLPELEKNLLSVRAMTKLGAAVEFAGDECRISRNGKELAVGELHGKLYVLKLVQEEHAKVAREGSGDKQLWHCRLGHLGMSNLEKLCKEEMVEGMTLNTNERSESLCEGCIMGKQHRTPNPKASLTRATRPYCTVHSDVCGPMSVNSLGGSRYFVTFIDDFTRYTHVYFLKQKSEVLEKFQEFVNFTTNKTEKQVTNLVTTNRVQNLRSDNGGEYESKLFGEYLKSRGIHHQTTVPDNPAQNGVAERMNRTIVEAARSMMCHANMPQSFWAEAVSTAVYLRNRSPTVSVKGVTPYQQWFGQKPDVSNLKVFGCVAYVHVAKNNRKKFDAKSRRAVFVGYPEGTKGYKLYNPATGRFIKSRDVLFAEKDFHDFHNEQSLKPDLFYPDAVQPESREEEENDAGGANREDDGVRNRQPVGENFEDRFMREVQELGDRRQHRPPRRFAEEECYATTLTADIDEPSHINEALNGEYAVQWKHATDAEYESLMKNGTWDLVPLPKDKNIVGSRWVFKVKRNADGSIDRFKARMVAQGYSQSEGIDYEEVFSPVVKYTSLRTLLALANTNNWEVHQMDVRTAFLQGSLDTDIYMRQPDGYVSKEKPDHVCKLKKSLYGLKQAARCWNLEIDTFLKSSGFRSCDADPCVYIKSYRHEDGQVYFVILTLWVDDIMVFSNNMDMMIREKRELNTRFDITDQGEVHYILGMLVQRRRDHKTLTISQPKYVEGILKKFGMQDCKSVATPAEPGKKFEKLSESESPSDTRLYQEIIGSLTYLATATRPDISAAVSVLSKYMSRPGVQHMQGAKRILRYLKGTVDYGLVYTGDDKDVLSGYSDADWAGDVDTRRSTSGFVFQVHNNTVSWCSKRQNTVAKSSTEAEYVALSLATQEAIWMRRFLKNIGVEQKSSSIIFEDNRGAIELSKNPKFHNRTKHIDVSYHFIREQVTMNTISVKYCPTQEMLADVMTKGLTKFTFEKFRNMLGLKKVC